MLDEINNQDENQKYDLQTLRKTIEFAHSNLKECKKSLSENYSQEQEDFFVHKARIYFTRIYNCSVHNKDYDKDLTKEQKMIVFGNDLLASRGYHLFVAFFDILRSITKKSWQKGIVVWQCFYLAPQPGAVNLSCLLF